uniref:protein SLOW GREEN 1, chloroplastic n=1 Tax=Erigeron canadensis TaxID=72917 RepID=UPI001CB9942E|nr:protein SLOW GREEN 1, chloroplastic [Erigeron canadensis]
MELSLTKITSPFTKTTSFPSFTHTANPISKSITFPKTTSFRSLPKIKSSIYNNHTISPTPKTLNPNLPSFIKTTFITGVTVAAVILSRFPTKPSIAVAAPPPPPTVEVTEEEKTHEKTLEEQLDKHPDDKNVLKSLMEVKIKIGKVQEAIGILNQLINLEPEDSEWQLLKYHLHSYSGDHDSAKSGFEQILEKDPFRVEAYHGLVMAASASESLDALKDIEKRVLEGMEMCKKSKKKDDVRDFKLLLAQIRVIQGEYDEALKIYEELSKEEARDFRPYLCQGIIYTLLGKNDEAEKMFGKYRRLVPKGHPYTRYFDENMVATKVFAQKVENERAFSKS